MNEIATADKMIGLDSALASIEQKDAETNSIVSQAQNAGFIDIFSSLANTMGVSLSEAVQQSAFLLCCDVIAQDLAKAPLYLCKRDGRNVGDVVDANDHPLAFRLFTEPNSRHTWMEFQEMMGLWGAYAQNAYAFVQRNYFGDPIALIPLQTYRVNRPQFDENGAYYNVTAGSEQEAQLLGGYFRQIRERDMIHVRGRMIDGMMGLSTMYVGQNTLSTGEAIDGYREQIYSQDAQIRGVFHKPAGEVMPEAAYQRLRLSLGQMLRRYVKNSEPVVLEGGMTFQEIASDPTEAQITQQFDAQIDATCRLLRIPPQKVFHTTNVKYDNLETLEKSYIGDTLEPIFRRYEQRYSKILLSPQDQMKYQIWIDRDAIQIQDAKTLNERIKQDAGLGIMTVGEARRLRRLPKAPAAWSNTRLVPVNMQVVGDDNEIVVQASQSQQDAGAGPGDDVSGGQPADPSK